VSGYTGIVNLGAYNYMMSLHNLGWLFDYSLGNFGLLVIFIILQSSFLLNNGISL
jgi:hypothetical protein